MPISPADLIAAAESYTKAADEATLRSAVSRGYYGAYHDSVKWNDALPHPAPMPLPGQGGGGMHFQFQQALKNSDPRNGRPTMLKSTRRSVLLRSLHQRRIEADYDLNLSMSNAEADTAVEDAKKILLVV